LTLGRELVAVFNDLMGTGNEIKVVLLQELVHNIRTKCERDTTIVLTPSDNVLIGVGPEEITEETSVGDISGTHDATNLFHRVEVRRKPSVHTEDLLINNSANGKAVEAVSEGLPQLNVVAALALVVETVDSVNGSTLVVATKNEEVLRELDLVSKEKGNGLKRLLSTINVVTEEEVVRLRREATVLKQSEKIIVLTVNVTANLQGGLQLQQNGLRDENLTGLHAKTTDLSLSKLNLLAWTCTSHFQKAVNNGVNVQFHD